jgi:hypothetical protein
MTETTRYLFYANGLGGWAVVQIKSNRFSRVGIRANVYYCSPKFHGATARLSTQNTTAPLAESGRGLVVEYPNAYSGPIMNVRYPSGSDLGGRTIVRELYQTKDLAQRDQDTRVQDAGLSHSSRLERK